MLWGPILFSTKLALLLLFWRLFHSTGILRYMIYFGAAFHFALYTSYMFLSFFLCPQTFAVKCLNQLNMLFVVSTSLNISGDLYLLFLPIFAVARLQIPTRFKLSLVAVFSTGLLYVTRSRLLLETRLIGFTEPVSPAFLPYISEQGFTLHRISHGTLHLYLFSRKSISRSE